MHAKPASLPVVMLVLIGLWVNRPVFAQSPVKTKNIELLLTGLDPASQTAIDSVPLLIAAILNERLSDTLRQQAGMTLGRIGNPAVAAVPVLIDFLQNEQHHHSETRFWAAKSLGLFGSLAGKAVPVLSADLNDKSRSFEDRILAADVLGHIGTSAAVQSLARELQRHVGIADRSESLLVEVAIDAIAQAGPNGEVALPALIRMTAYDKASVRRKACVAIGRLGPRAELSLNPLLERLVLDDDPAVRDAAAAAMSRIGPVAVPTLIQIVDSGQPDLQWRAAHALRQIGPRAASATTALRQASSSDSPVVRIACLEAMWRIGGKSESVAPSLLPELSSADRQIRRRASQLLIELTSLPPGIIDQLEKLAAARTRDASRAAGYVLRERQRRMQ